LLNTKKCNYFNVLTSAQATEQRLQRKGQELQQYQQNAGAQVQNEQVGEQPNCTKNWLSLQKLTLKKKAIK
jgi:outer membrane protein